MAYRDSEDGEFGLVWSAHDGWHYLIPEELTGDEAVPMEAHFLLAILQRMCKEPEFIKEMMLWLEDDLNPHKYN